MLSICQLHILLSRTAQISLELHFCVELHIKKALRRAIFSDLSFKNILVLHTPVDYRVYNLLLLTLPVRLLQ